MQLCTVFGLRYRCFPNVADEQVSTQLAALAEELDVDCPTAPSYVRVKVGYTIALRKRPNASSESLGFMDQGVLLDFLSRQGAWVKVRHWNDVVGYVRNSEVELYPAQ